MFTDLTLFSVVLLLAAGQGLFLALALLLIKKGNWLANRYLGLFTFAIVITMVDISIAGSSNEPSAVFIMTLIWPRDYLYGPAFYFYVREMTLPGKYSLSPVQWLHFLPALLHAVIFWTLASVYSPSLSNAILASNSDTETEVGLLAEIIGNFEQFSSIFHIGIYLCLSVWVLRSHRQRIESTFSYAEHISLNWLRWLLIGFVAVYLTWMVADVLGDFVKLPEAFDYLLGVSMVLLVYSMSILGLRQPVIFAAQTATLVMEAETGKESDTQKYKTSSLSDDLSQQLVAELQDLMSSKKPHLDSQLSLPQLAGQLGISANYLSQIVNEQLQQNFFEFVNHHRIDYAKVLLSDASRKNENILTIALDSGFNSRSSFYTAFKKHTKMTPGEYRKRA